MAKSKHRTTKRGTQKKRAREHDAYLQVAHPKLWAQRVHQEYLAAQMK